jgi:GNAT superfamily N-acetyltransferase
MTISIRAAGIGDVPLLLQFIRELAIYEKAEDQVEATPDTLARSLFGPDSPSRALVCEQDGRAVGFAVYFFNYSTWQARKGLYLEDLFVQPTARGQGAGKRLLQHLAAIAVREGCGRFEWSVLDWNRPAIDFYEAIGAKPQSEWVRYRLHGQALRDFAAGTA